MRIGGASRCCLAAILSAYTFLAVTEARATDNVDSGSAFVGASAATFAGASAGAGASALSSANAFSGTFAGTGTLAGAHDSHKGIRSYDNTGYQYDNDAGRATKSHGTPWDQHGTGHNRGTKGGDHRDKSGDDCSKCKWENDDYWEREEPEEEGNEKDGDECDDGDDGQYRPDKTHHLHHDGGPGRGHGSGSHPPGVYKTGPTDAYSGPVKGAVKGKPNGPFGSPGYPANVYAGAASGLGTTPKPGPGWQSPFDTSRPGDSGVTANVYGTSPSGLPWSRGSTPKPAWGDEQGVASPGSTPRPNWSTDGIAGTPTAGFPTSHKPASDWQQPGQDNAFAGSYGSTPGPASWNTGPTGAPASGFPSSSRSSAPWNLGHDGGAPTAGFPSSQKPTLGWNTGYDNTPVGSYGSTPKPPSTWNVGSTGAPTGVFPSSPRPGAPWNLGHDGSVPTAGLPSSQRPIPSWNTGYDNPPIGTYGSTQKPPSTWNAGPTGAPTSGFPSSLKPESWNTGNTPAASYGTTPTPGQDWNTDFGGKPQSSWNSDHGPAPGATSGCTRPDAGCNRDKGPIKVGATPVAFDSTNQPASPGAPYGGDGAFPPGHGGPNQNQNWPYGQPGIQSTIGAYAGSGATAGYGSTPRAGTPDFTKKEHPSFDKPASDLRPPYGGLDQTHPTPGTGTGTYGPGGTFDYNRPGSTPHGAWPSSTSSTFGTTQGSQARPGSPGNIPGTQGNVFNPVKSPGFPGVSKPSYGSGSTTVSWSSTGGSTWPDSSTTGAHTGFSTPSTGFGTTKSPFGHGSTSFPDSSYGGIGSKQPGFNVASSSATASANAFGPSFGAHSTPGTTGRTPLPLTTPGYTGSSTYPGVKGLPGSSRPTQSYGTTPHATKPGIGTGAWAGAQAGSVSGTWPGAQPSGAGGTWPGAQPSGAGGTWPGRQPGSGSETIPGSGYPGIGDGTWPGGQTTSRPGTWPGGQTTSRPGTWPGGQTTSMPGTWPGGQTTSRPGFWPGVQSSSHRPDIGSGTWPEGQTGITSGIRPGGRPEGASGTWPGSGSTIAPSTGHSGIEGGAWPGKQPGHKTWSDGQTGHGGGLGCTKNYNCPVGCSGSGDNAPATHGPCYDGPSGVNKTYYPAGTGDGNVPHLVNTYGSGGVTQGSVQWNPANPFLHGGAGGIASDISRPWSETTTKPIGQGNPFLDPNWNDPRPNYVGSNVNDNRNVIPLRETFNKDNPFLSDDKRRVDSVEGVIPLGGKRTDENNPFLKPTGSGSAGPPYTGHPVGSPGSGIPGSDYGGIKGGGSHPIVPPQGGNIDGSYPPRGDIQSPGPLQCKQGLFGCGTPGSGSYSPTKGGKHPIGTFGGIGGNIGTGSGAPGGVGVGAASGSYAGGFGSGAPYPGSTGPAGGHGGAYAGSFSSAQASSSSFANAKSLSYAGGAAGADNNFGSTGSRDWSSNGAQNQGGPNSWASSGASAFASSNSGSWSGNRSPIGVSA